MNKPLLVELNCKLHIILLEIQVNSRPKLQHQVTSTKKKTTAQENKT